MRGEGGCPGDHYVVLPGKGQSPRHIFCELAAKPLDYFAMTDCVYVCVVIPFILDVRLVHAPAEVTQEESHSGFLHLPSTVLIPVCETAPRFELTSPTSEGFEVTN